MGLDWGGVWHVAQITLFLVAFTSALVMLLFFLPAWTGRRFRMAADTWPSWRSARNALGFYLGAAILGWLWVDLVLSMVNRGFQPAHVPVSIIWTLACAPAFFEAKRKNLAGNYV